MPLGNDKMAALSFPPLEDPCTIMRDMTLKGAPEPTNSKVKGKGSRQPFRRQSLRSGFPSSLCRRFIACSRIPHSKPRFSQGSLSPGDTHVTMARGRCEAAQ